MQNSTYPFANLGDIEAKDLTDEERDKALVEKLDAFRKDKAEYVDDKEFVDDVVSRWQNHPWWKNLAEETRKKALRILVEGMQDDATLKQNFKEKVKLIEWGLNCDRRKRQRHKMKNASFMTLYA